MNKTLALFYDFYTSWGQGKCPCCGRDTVLYNRRGGAMCLCLACIRVRFLPVPPRRPGWPPFDLRPHDYVCDEFTT